MILLNFAEFCIGSYFYDVEGLGFVHLSFFNSDSLANGSMICGAGLWHGYEYVYINYVYVISH